MKRLDIDAIHAYLNRAYWSEGIPLETVRLAVTHSLCVGIYAPDGAQVGFARIVTDQATFAYLADVYVLEDHRGLYGPAFGHSSAAVFAGDFGRARALSAIWV